MLARSEPLKVLMLATRSEPEITTYPDSGKVSAWHLAPDGTLTLEVDGQQVGLSAKLSDNLWVRPSSAAG